MAKSIHLSINSDNILDALKVLDLDNSYLARLAFALSFAWNDKYTWLESDTRWETEINVYSLIKSDDDKFFYKTFLSSKYKKAFGDDEFLTYFRFHIDRWFEKLYNIRERCWKNKNEFFKSLSESV